MRRTDNPLIGEKKLAPPEINQAELGKINPSRESEEIKPRSSTIIDAVGNRKGRGTS